MQLDRQVDIQVRTTTTAQCPNQQQLEYTEEIFHSIELGAVRFDQITDRTGSPAPTSRCGNFRDGRIRIVLRGEIRFKDLSGAGGVRPSYKTAGGDTLH